MAGICPTPLNKKSLIDLAGLTLLAAVVATAYHFSPLLLPAADQTLPISDCDLQQQACAVALPGGTRISLNVSPQPIPMVKPFTVTAHVESGHLEAAEIDFAGVDMNMGLNRFSLKEARPGEWQAEARIPVCVTGRMAWQATLTVASGQRRISVPFRFFSSEHAE